MEDSMLAEKIALKDYRSPTLSRLHNITPDKIASIVNSVPKEWLLSESDAADLIDYLQTRFGRGEQYLSLILKEEPK